MEETFNEANTNTNQEEIKCSSCGAFLHYAIGTTKLQCQYCGGENEIETEEVEIVENDFLAFIREQESHETTVSITTVQCDGCGANSQLDKHLTASECPFCATPLVVKNGQKGNFIAPQYLLPFKIERKKAEEEFVKWVKSLWFAPNDLLKNAKHTMEKFNGVYMPYWTYDADTVTHYTGQRGDHYYVTVSYKDSEGKTQTRQERRTRWSFTSGIVHVNFDDVLVCASKALPDDMTRSLEPWDLHELTSYKDEYLSGFKSECYQISAEEGFEVGKSVMADKIHSAICRQIGGDEQRVSSKKTQYNDIKFKYILLPLWISAFKYQQKPYRFTVNARTGEVHGTRPYSAIKIALAVIAGLAIIGAIIYYFNTHQA